MSWEQQITEHWKRLDQVEGPVFVAEMKRLCSLKATGDPEASFELACAFDSTGHPDAAVPLYRIALEGGLEGIRRRRAVIQMASSLRNLGQGQESVRLLRVEKTQPSDELDDAVVATLALALSSTGNDRDALSLALVALARHLPRYQRSMTNYAQALVAP